MALVIRYVDTQGTITKAEEGIRLKSRERGNVEVAAHQAETEITIEEENERRVSDVVQVYD